MKALIILLTLCGQAAASDFELTLGGWSKHLGSPDNFAAYVNETHNAYGLRYKNIEISTMTNSHHRRTVTLGGIYRYKLNDNFEVGVRGGVATGYIDQDISMFVHPHAVGFYKNFGVEIGWIPDLNKWHPYGVLTATGKVRF